MVSLNLKNQFGRFLREAPMKVFVGSEKKIYYVHPGVLLACKASTADVRMSGYWKDTGEGAIDWTDFDRQTIECVLQYLYTGDYHVSRFSDEASTCAEIIPEQTEGALNTEEPPPADEESMLSQSPLPDESSLARPLTPISDCFGVGFPAESVQTAAGVIAETDFERDKHTVGTSVLTHARVYSFAHRHFFTDLATLALQRLTQMVSLAPCECTVLFPHLADAIRHIYETTPGPDMQKDPARKLLSQYVALNYTNLVGKELDTLAGEGGELMVDLSNKLARLLAMRSSQIGSLESQINVLSTEVGTLQAICNDKEKEIQKVRGNLEDLKTWNKKRKGSLI